MERTLKKFHPHNIPPARAVGGRAFALKAVRFKFRSPEATSKKEKQP